MIAQNQQSKALSEIERSIPNLESISDFKNLLNQFESVDEDYRDKNFLHLYLSMWRVALKLGKLNLAKSYSQKALDYLITYKRIPQIKILISNLHAAGLFKNNLDIYQKKTEILLGKKEKLTKEDFHFFELMEDHPEHWKDFSEFLKQYLLINDEWSVNEWKLCYEYILINQFDKELFLILFAKAQESKSTKITNKFSTLFEAKKIKIKDYIPTPEQEKKSQKNEKLNVDYDQVAMDLLSGSIEPTFEEQRRVLNSLKLISDEELKTKGQHMIVAFELLGMEQVVLSLCEQMVKILDDVKEKASVFYVWAQALNNNGDFFKAIDLIDEVLNVEPLYEEERLAFVYLKAEACLKLKKIKMAKQLFMEIKKYNPHYRLVGERLKEIETA